MSNSNNTDGRTRRLIDNLRAQRAETTWIEFKQNNAQPALIGKLVSALSNAARLADQDYAYVLWGVRDGDHEPVGTTFEPSSVVVQQQPLEFWLAQRLSPDVAIQFTCVDYDKTRDMRE